VGGRLYCLRGASKKPLPSAPRANGSRARNIPHRRSSSLVAAIAFSAIVSGPALALDAAQPTPSPTPAADAGAKAAKSAECYRQADIKNLHSYERRKFHHECMKAQ
jgi:hypothetical protein